MVNIDKNPPWFRTADKCRYSGQAVTHPDIFVSRHPDSNYFVDIAKLGDRIFLVKASGYVRSYEMTDALQFMDAYVSKYFDIASGIFLIEDYADVAGADFEARKKYIDHHKNSAVFQGAILYNLPIIFRISFKIAKRLHVHGKHLYSVDSFEQAVLLAEGIVNRLDAGHVPGRDHDSEFLAFLEKSTEKAKRFYDHLSEKISHFKTRPAFRNTQNIQRQYSESLLRYIESIDWHRDGVEVPADDVFTDPHVRKVAEAISYIKSEMDDLLKERDAAEQVLRESEVRYRQLVEHAQAGILEYDYQTNRIISVNDSFLGISGYSKEEIVSMDPLDLMTPESQKIYAERHALRLSGKTVSPDSAYEFIARNGSKKWVLISSNITYKDSRPLKADIVAINITHLKEIENELIRYQSKLKKLSIQLSKTEETQRRRLASRLHESVSQELFAAQLKLNVLEKALDDPKHARLIDEIKEQMVKSIREIRGITYDLSPPVLYDLGLKEAVEFLARSIESKYHLTVETLFSGCMEHLDEEIKLIFYRVIKEITQNTIKHAQADLITIDIEKTDNDLCLDVSDNGIGFDTAAVAEGQYAGEGFGLFDVREKIKHLGGDLRICSTPCAGTRISLIVPVTDPAVKSSRVPPQTPPALSR